MVFNRPKVEDSPSPQSLHFYVNFFSALGFMKVKQTKKISGTLGKKQIVQIIGERVRQIRRRHRWNRAGQEEQEQENHNLQRKRETKMRQTLLTFADVKNCSKLDLIRFGSKDFQEKRKHFCVKLPGPRVAHNTFFSSSVKKHKRTVETHLQDAWTASDVLCKVSAI